MAKFNMEFREPEKMGFKFGQVQQVNTNNYNDLFNKPRLNNVTIEGAKESEDYKLTLSVQEIEQILYL